MHLKEHLEKIQQPSLSYGLVIFFPYANFLPRVWCHVLLLIPGVYSSRHMAGSQCAHHEKHERLKKREK